jgi:phosphatidylglycerophosphate synthase
VVPERDEFLSRWSDLHGGVSPRGLVGGWLSLIYPLARPLAAARVPPIVPTLLGVALAVAALGPAAAGGRWVLPAVALVVLSAALDSVDGAVAVLTGRVTARGAVLDGLCDRISDLAYVGALWLTGAPAGWCVAGGAIALLHEQLRASARATGLTEVGAVTVSERPTRVIVTAAFLLGAGLYPATAGDWATGGAVAWTVVGAVGFVQLYLALSRRLS